MTTGPVHTLELGAGTLVNSTWVTLFTVPTGFVYVPTCIDFTAEQSEGIHRQVSFKLSQDHTIDALVLAGVMVLATQYSRGFWHWTGRREVPEGASWYGWKDPGDADTVSYRITGYKLTLP